MNGQTLALEGPKVSPLREAIWRDQEPEARALVALLAEEVHERIVLDVYIAVLTARRDALAVKAGPEGFVLDVERAAVESAAVERFAVTAGPSFVKVTPPPYRQVVKSIARREGVDVDDVFRPDGRHRFARLRHEAWFELHARRLDDGAREYPIARLSRLFGADHTCIKYGLRQHCRRNAIDPAVLA